ncbi:hypothetical protein M404DRAFT_638118 [Pisolithus tinctorius Marx 270]|uniref:Uncharacterized protein n=1 Tax=Pisolithus tinctorius Marx 270 TaxID=870435 RepID=A0A0C3NQ14_PISTI|nr:hypothetical protein M404DRAFT_245662 [Pisolithus tinctorius Marx 270]KIO02955.1 hypothetical protein M404DRAFT_638118 [Pisolithus tinctorius Marx 270]
MDCLVAKIACPYVHIYPPTVNHPVWECFEGSEESVEITIQESTRNSSFSK